MVVKVDEYILSVYRTGDQSLVDVAALSSGNYFAMVWTSYLQEGSPSANGYDIIARVSLTEGTSINGEFIVNQNVLGDQVYPQVAALTNDKFVVVWEDHYTNTIKARVFNYNSTPYTNEITVSDTSAVTRSVPAVAKTSGGFAVAWQQADSLLATPNNIDIYYRLLTESGSFLRSAEQLNTYTAGYQRFPAIAVASNQNIIIVWDGGENGKGISARVLNSNGDTIQGDKSIMSTSGTFYSYNDPEISCLNDGKCVVVSGLLNSDTTLDTAYGQKIDSDYGATKIGSLFLIGTGGETRPDISAWPQLGYAFIVWNPGSAVYGRVLDTIQETWIGPEFLVNAYGIGSQKLPRVASLQGGIKPGNTIVVWQSYDEDGSDWGVKAAVYYGPLVATNTNQNLQYTEDVAFNLGDIVISNSPASTVTATLTLPLAARGSLSTPSSGGYTATYNSGTGVWQITAPRANANTILAAVTYQPPSNYNSNFNIGVSITDAVGNDPVTGTIALTGIAVNDAPTLGGNGGSITYIENDNNTPIVIDNTVTVSDIDSTNLNSATVTIASGFVNGEDELLFTNQNGISGNYNSASGVLTLTGTATIANYQAALRTVTYRNTSNNPNMTQRRIDFRVNDGSLNSIIYSRNIDITPTNDAPVLTGTGGAITYVENTSGVVIDGALIVDDVDSTTLVNATIAITNNFTIVEDVLEFINQNGITGSYDGNTGVLTLSGVASRATYQSALRTVTYRNTSTNPSTAARTVVFTANDGQASSTPFARTLNIGSVNNAPTLVSNLVISEGETKVLTLSDLSAQDLEGMTPLTFTIPNVQNGQFALATNPNVAVTNFTQQQIQDGEIVFIHDGSENAPTATVLVEDALGAQSQTETLNFVFTNLNDKPVLVNLVPDQTATQDEPFSFVIAPNTFNDPDNDALTLSATQEDGSALPAWVQFNGGTRTFSGTAPLVGTNRFTLFAHDPSDAIANTPVNLLVNAKVEEAPADPVTDTNTWISIVAGTIGAITGCATILGGGYGLYRYLKNRQATTQEKDSAQHEMQNTQTNSN